MTALVWDAVGSRYYENGIDRGVLYVQNKGVAWNGLLGVDHNNTNEVSPVYIDGFKTLNIVSLGDFEATLRAYTYPDEFVLYDGYAREEGLFVAEQPLQEFNLSYRTQVGNDTYGREASYRIHLLYNLTAVADTRSYSTYSLETTPIEFSWTLHSRPEEVAGYRPSAHIIVDSMLWTKYRLDAFEELLYGTPTSPPTMPSFKDMLTLLDPHNELVIIDHGDGEYSAIDLSDNNIYKYNLELFSVDAPTVTMVDVSTFDVSTYTL